MSLISKLLPYQVWLILWLPCSVLTYLRASTRGKIMLPPISDSFVHWTLQSDQFVTTSQNLVYMVYFMYLPGTCILGASMHGGNIQHFWCVSLRCYLCLASSIFECVPILCSLVAIRIACLLIWIFFDWYFVGE